MFRNKFKRSYIKELNKMHEYGRTNRNYQKEIDDYEQNQTGDYNFEKDLKELDEYEKQVLDQKVKDYKE